jgi:hypothetical protein
VTLTVQLVVAETGAEHVQRFHADGRCEWSSERAPAADLLVHLPERVARALRAGEMLGDPGLAELRVVGSDGTLHPLPPLHDSPCRDMERRAGASMTIGYDIPDSPCGPMHAVEVFVDGQLIDCRLGVRPVDLRIEIGYGALLRFRAGDIDLFEVLTLGRVHSIEPFVNLAAALVDDPAYRRHIARDARLLELTQRWATHLARPEAYA